jgi:hypothetical protein
MTSTSDATVAASASTTAAKAAGDANSGLRSRKSTPGSGKSGTVRISSSALSTESTG